MPLDDRETPGRDRRILRRGNNWELGKLGARSNECFPLLTRPGLDPR